MEKSASETYLEEQILTATPQKLRLMLIEGALRLARQTIDQWAAGDNEIALESLIRCRGIITELLSSIQVDQSELTRRVAGLYLFLFQQLTTAQLRRDVQCLHEVLRVLEIERETWRQVCQQLVESPPTTAGPREVIAPLDTAAFGSQADCGISFDA